MSWWDDDGYYKESFWELVALAAATVFGLLVIGLLLEVLK